MKESIEIVTADNFKLSASLFYPLGKAKAGIIINSATAVKQGYYEKFALFLAEHNYIVITYDYRGIGKSAIANTRDKILTMQAWGEKDLVAVIDYATAQDASIDWHCIGHSVGGQLIGLASNNTLLKSAYCISSQSGYWMHWPSYRKLKMLFTWYALIPGFSKAIGKVPGMLLGGESLPEGVARQWAYWGRHKDYIVNQTGKPIRDGFSKIQYSMKFLLIEDDIDFAPPKAVEALRQFYNNAATEIQLIRPADLGASFIGHFGFFKKDYKNTLWVDVLNWVSKTTTLN